MKTAQPNYSRLIVVFFLGVLLLTYPIISLFDHPRLIFGIPLLFLYLFSVWLCLILLIYLIMRTPQNNNKSNNIPDIGAHRKGR